MSLKWKLNLPSDRRQRLSACNVKVSDTWPGALRVAFFRKQVKSNDRSVLRIDKSGVIRYPDSNHIWRITFTSHHADHHWADWWTEGDALYHWAWTSGWQGNPHFFSERYRIWQEVCHTALMTTSSFSSLHIPGKLHDAQNAVRASWKQSL